MINDKNIKFFEQNGYLHIKNFFTDNDINSISNRCRHIIENNSLYEFKLEDIKQLEINDKIKNYLIDYFQNKELEIENFEKLTEIVDEILPNKSQRDKLFIIEKIHKKLCKTFGKKDADILFDTILSKLILKEKLLLILNKILNTDELVYWGESGIQYNKPSVKGWHTDDPLNEINNNFTNTFQVRVAVYFHSVKSFSGGIKLLPGSHLKIRPVDFLKSLIRGKNKINKINKINWNFSKNIFPDSKDILIWDKRLFHSPWATKLKFGLNFSFSPKLENYIPKFLIEPPCFPRSLLGFDIGKKSIELSNYLKNWISIRRDYKEIWSSKNIKYKNKITQIKDLGLNFDETCIGDKNIERINTINKTHRDLLIK